MPKGRYDPQRRSRGKRPSLEARFWAKVTKTDGCWLWTAAVFAGGLGYGQFAWPGRKTVLAHRAAWFLTHGEWPRMDLAHTCDTPACVNPDHLWEATQLENVRDMAGKGRARFYGVGANWKLDDDQVQEILDAVATGPRGTAHRMAVRFGVSDSLISMIVNQKRRSTPRPSL